MEIIIKNMGITFGNGHQYHSVSYVREIEEKDLTGSLSQGVAPQEKVFEEAEVGDLALVPCELWFYPTRYGNVIWNKEPREILSLKSIMCTRGGTPVRNSDLEPVCQVSCVMDIEKYLKLTEHEIEKSSFYAADVELYPKIPGLLKSNTIWLGDSVVETYFLYWLRRDLFSAIPNLVERRPWAHWMLGEILMEENKRPDKSTMIDLPVLGTAGVVVEKKILNHGLTNKGIYIAGDTHQSTFYRVLFGGNRPPVWVFGNVWKSPKKLILPIYFPIL